MVKATNTLNPSVKRGTYKEKSIRYQPGSAKPRRGHPLRLQSSILSAIMDMDMPTIL